MKTYGGMDVLIHVFLTSALVEVVSSTPRSLYPWGKSPLYRLDRRLGLDSMEEKNLVPTKTQSPTPWPSSPKPVTTPTALSQPQERERNYIFRERFGNTNFVTEAEWKDYNVTDCV
jgi:hypothetical protein